MICTYCNKEIPDNTTYCEYCGGENKIVTTNDVTQNEELVSFNKSNTLSVDLNKEDTKENNYNQTKNPKGKNESKKTKEKKIKNTKIKDYNSPLSFNSCLLMVLIITIPILNIIMLLVWSFMKNVNTTKKNFARAILFLCIVSYAVFSIIGVDILSSIRAL